MRRASRLNLLLLALLLTMVGMSARATLVALHVASKQQAAPAVRGGFDTQAHFPGAALLYAQETAAEPRAISGTTGTAPLPPMPSIAIPASLLEADDSIHPAPPFSMAKASNIDFGRALNCLATAISYEAASEPDAGQRAVAQVVLNRVRHPAFPGTVCGVVFQGSERAGCQFSFACDGALARTPSRTGWARALRNAALMLGGSVEAEVGTATHYHTYAVTPAWNRQMVMTAAIGAHFFHRWQGYWGTLASLSRPYRGGEPLPGPHPRIDASPAPLLAAAQPAPVPVTRADQLQPAYAGASVAKAAPPVEDSLPQSQILDKWKDSGKPLR